MVPLKDGMNLRENTTLTKVHILNGGYNGGKPPETMRKLCLSTNFHTRKFGKITVFYAVSRVITLDKHQPKYILY